MSTPRPAYQPGEQYLQLRMHLMRRGLSLRRIAQALDISHQWLGAVLRKGWPAPHIRQRLEDEYDIPARLVRYHSSMMRRRGRPVNARAK